MLSVIIPTYRRTDSLGQLLRLLNQQTISDKLEVLVLDQNEIGFLEKEISISNYVDVQCIRLDRPNASLARNTGAVRAKYGHLLFIDDDLVPGDDFCEKGMRFFDKYNFVECFTPWLKTDLRQADPVRPVKDNIIKIINEELFLITDTVSAAVFMTKKSFFKSGGFDVHLFEFAKTAEDQEFFLRFPFKEIKLYYTPSFFIFHDEAQTGGCDLRTVDYWITREKCMKAWVYRYKIHRGINSPLKFSDYFGLYRSAFLNRTGLTGGLSVLKKQVRLLKKVFKETNDYLRKHKMQYAKPAAITHLTSTSQPVHNV